MGLFSRSPDVEVTISPAVVTPRQTVTATVVANQPVDKVIAASLDWGYTNYFNYHWAGRVDSAAAAANDTLWTAGQVGTNYGGDRDTDEWVGVTKVDLPIATGEFTGGTSTFKVPSWAPASSEQIAQWSCQLTVERGGRDIDTRGVFTVLVGAGDVDAPSEPTAVIMGSAETIIDISIATTVFRAGEPIRGYVNLIPTMDLPDGDVAVCWRRCRASHPLTRAPGPGGELDGPIMHLGKRIPMRVGSPFGLPFEIPLPADAPPTATAVHSSMDWFIHARLFYAGFNSHLPERVLRPIAVVNA